MTFLISSNSGSSPKFLLESGLWTASRRHSELLTFRDSKSAAQFLSKFIKLFPLADGFCSVTRAEVLKIDQELKKITMAYSPRT